MLILTSFIALYTHNQKKRKMISSSPPVTHSQGHVTPGGSNVPMGVNGALPGTFLILDKTLGLMKSFCVSFDYELYFSKSYR